jgi:hypothetical protein
MSSLIFYTDPDQALVVTDTLAVEPDGSPLLFTSKAHYLPHLRTIVAGTGLAGFHAEWAISVNNRMAVSGVQNLNHHAQRGLRDLWGRFADAQRLPAGITTTVYHFGISEGGEGLAAYAYRSANDFTSEKISVGIGVKPYCTVPEVGLEHLLDNVEAMMNEQRRLQEMEPPDRRLYIGGEAHAIHLTRNGCTFACLFQFSDFRTQQAQVARSLHVLTPPTER